MPNGPFSSPPRHSPPPRFSPRQRALAQWRGWNWSSDEIARQASGKKAAAILPGVLTGLRMDRRQA
jgi:hypothetical protein